MSGITITLKNVPADLHRSLKESAQRHKRSLNREALHILETSLFGDQTRRFSLRQPLPARSMGKILVSPEDLVSRADDVLDTGK